jgi:hypothetical protein
LQQRRNTSTLCASCDWKNAMLFHTSAWRAAMPISSFSPPPPTRSLGGRTGLGSQRASFTLKWRPWKVVVSSLHKLFKIVSISSRARSRSGRLGKAQPVLLNSGSNQPAPKPGVARPPEI